MSRRKKAIKRKLLPDPKFNNVLAARFINSLMKQGKRSVAERIFYLAIDLVEERAGQDAIDIFQKALEIESKRMHSNLVYTRQGRSTRVQN